MKLRRRKAGTHGQTQEQFDCGTVAAALAVALVDVPADLDVDANAGSDAPRGAHVMRDLVGADPRLGAHVHAADPLWSVERRALHAKPEEPVVEPAPAPPDTQPAPSVTPDPVVTIPVVTTIPVPSPRDPAIATPKVRRAKRSRPYATRGRRWGFVPVAGALTAVAAGLGGGAAYAFFSGGPGTGRVATGAPVTITAGATAGAADLLPGRTGAVYFTLHNPNSVGTTFEQVVPGATIVSNDTARCPSSDVTIAQPLPYTIPGGVTVSSGGTSGIQSIANLVKLASNAPDTCQGVTFTVTLTLSGLSS